MLEQDLSSLSTKIMKALFKVLAKINNAVLPKYSDKDLTKLSKFQKAIVGYRYWVTKQSLKGSQKPEAEDK